MRKLLLCLTAVPLLAVTAADKLPLTRGIYVSVGAACKGASNADIVSYWGGNNAINISQVECSIKRVSHVGGNYTVVRSCRNLQGNDMGIDTIKLVIANPKSMTIDGTAYRWCGTKVQF